MSTRNGWRRRMANYRSGRGGGGHSQGHGGEPGILENLFFLATLSGTVLIVSWIVLRIVGGIIKRFNDSLMAEIRINAGIRNTFYHEDDKLYQSLLRLLGELMPSTDFKNRTVTLRSKQLQNGKEEFEFITPPGYGVHYIQYGEGEGKGASWIRLERRQTPEIVCNKTPFESLSLSTYKWNKHLLFDLLAEAKRSQKEHKDEKTAFYYISCGDWEPFGEPKGRRKIESVITAGKIKEKLLKDVKEFLATEKWYMDRGIPWRRGYLLYGPPGTGKSSLIRSIAGEVGFDICILSLSSKDLTDDMLNRLMNSTPQDSIILLEDVDAAFNGREIGEATCSSGSKVTFRGLLNALDGVASTEGRIMFLTTNHLEKLDPALIRPGRVDMRIHIDYPTAPQIIKMFKRFYPKAKEEMADTLLHIMMGMERKISMAEIQGLFLLFKKDPQKVILHAEEYLSGKYFEGNNGNEDGTIDEDEDDEAFVELNGKGDHIRKEDLEQESEKKDDETNKKQRKNKNKQN